jgi:hypothetical protein
MPARASELPAADRGGGAAPGFAPGAVTALDAEREAARSVAKSVVAVENTFNMMDNMRP